MPKVNTHPNLKLHHNTWVIRYQIPKDCQKFFKAREYIKSTGFKKEQIIHALHERNVVIARLKQRVNDIRTGRIGNEPTIVELKEEATESYKEVQESVESAVREGNIKARDELLLGRNEKLNDLWVDLINKLLPNGMKAIHEHYGSPSVEGETLQDVLEDLNPEIYKQIEAQIYEVMGKGFVSRLDDFMQEREMKLVTPKYRSEHASRITHFAQEFPIIDKVTHREVKQWTRRLEQEGLATGTIKKRLGMLDNYWLYLQEKGLADEDIHPFKNHRLKQTKKIERKIFSVENARRLLVEPTYQSRRYPYLLDFIKLGFLTGCRVKEMCEIKKENITTFENTYVIDITAEMTKGNTSGIRKIPITKKMETVIEKRLEETKTKYLFHGVRNKHGDRTGHMSKRFGLHKTKLGFAKHVEVAHSFRHTANTILSKQEFKVPREHRDALFGWSEGVGAGMSLKNYGHLDESYPMNERLIDLEKLSSQFPFMD